MNTDILEIITSDQLKRRALSLAVSGLAQRVTNQIQADPEAGSPCDRYGFYGVPDALLLAERAAAQAGRKIKSALLAEAIWQECSRRLLQQLVL